MHERRAVKVVFEQHGSKSLCLECLLAPDGAGVLGGRPPRCHQLQSHLLPTGRAEDLGRGSAWGEGRHWGSRRREEKEARVLRHEWRLSHTQHLRAFGEPFALLSLWPSKPPHLSSLTPKHPQGELITLPAKETTNGHTKTNCSSGGRMRYRSSEPLSHNLLLPPSFLACLLLHM